MNDTAAPALPPRSTFVTVVAWVFICLGAGFALLAVLEALATLAVPVEQIQKMMNSSQGAGPMPAYTRFIIQHFRLYIALDFAAMFILFVTAIGLLKRKGWARTTMIVLLSLGAIRSIVGVALNLLYFSSASIAPPPNAPAEAGAVYQSMMSVIMYVSAAVSIAIAAALVWIIARLLSAPIRAEFQPPRTADAPGAEASAARM